MAGTAMLRATNGIAWPTLLSGRGGL